MDGQCVVQLITEVKPIQTSSRGCKSVCLIEYSQPESVAYGSFSLAVESLEPLLLMFVLDVAKLSGDS